MGYPRELENAVSADDSLAMMAMAAAALHGSVDRDIESIEEAYPTMAPALGPSAVGVFGPSLIIAGISSTVVGTLAGFHPMRIPVWMRRGITMVPSFVLIA